MGVIKGQNFRVLITGNEQSATAKVIAAATSCQLHIAADLEETSTKDDTAGWKSQSVVGKSWDGSADALVVVDSSETGVVAFGATELVGQTVTIEFEEVSGAQNRVAATGGTKFSGSAIINDLSLTAGNKSNATYSIQFQGVGALTKSTIS